MDQPEVWYLVAPKDGAFNDIRLVVKDLQEAQAACEDGCDIWRAELVPAKGP